MKTSRKLFSLLEAALENRATWWEKNRLHRKIAKNREIDRKRENQENETNFTQSSRFKPLFFS